MVGFLEKALRKTAIEQFKGQESNLVDSRNIEMRARELMAERDVEKAAKEKKRKQVRKEIEYLECLIPLGTKLTYLGVNMVVVELRPSRPPGFSPFHAVNIPSTKPGWVCEYEYKGEFKTKFFENDQYDAMTMGLD
jgi:hypothetical protein